MARRKTLPKALDIDFRGKLSVEVTPHAGAALLVELGRISGIMGENEGLIFRHSLPRELHFSAVSRIVRLGAVRDHLVDSRCHLILKPYTSAPQALSPNRNYGLGG